VVQYVLELKIPSANAHLASQFEGRYVYLSKQKVSSNVVEKCLKLFPDDAKAVIIRELLIGSHFNNCCKTLMPTTSFTLPFSTAG